MDHKGITGPQDLLKCYHSKDGLLWLDGTGNPILLIILLVLMLVKWILMTIGIQSKQGVKYTPTFPRPTKLAPQTALY